MVEHSAISWTDHTWNPWIGCTKVSPACDGCYAENLMATRYGRVEWGGPGKGAGTRVRTGAHTWNDPLRWSRKAEKEGTRPFVFCASLADIFDNQVPAEWRRDAFDVMRRTPRLVYLLLTKRPQLIAKLAKEAGGLPANAAIGTTIEDQKRADLNVPALLAAKSEVRPLFAFVSCEPLLGPIFIAEYMPIGTFNGLAPRDQEAIDWVITGGETDQGGHKARPSHPDWFRLLRDQSENCGVPFHHKQNGEWVSVSEVAGEGAHFSFDDGATVRRVGKHKSGRTIDGVEHQARPEVSPARSPSEPLNARTQGVEVGR